MQRFVLVLLLLLPVQWTWAAVASVCRHESSVHTNHFGHHEHRHDRQTSASTSAKAGDEAKAPASMRIARRAMALRLG